MGKRRVAALVTAALVTPLLVLGVEVELARRGPEGDPAPPGRDGCVGCEGVDPATVEQVLWLGDSTAAGDGASSAAGVLAQQVAHRLGRPARIRNIAVSGDTVGDARRDQLPGLRVPPGATVAISLGANDVTHLTGAGTFRRRYRQLLDALPRDARVVVLGIPDMGSPPRLAQPLRAIAGARSRQLDRIVRAEAARRAAVYVDIAGATSTRFRQDHSLFARDRYHPDDRGYALWAEAVAAQWPER